MDRPQAPPIKTQGIKTRLAPFISDHVAWDGRGRWVEPFLGSGAVLLNLRPERALAADTCRPVIDFYRGVRDGGITAGRVRAFLEREGARLRADGGEHYYRVRERFNREGDPLDFLFLSRAGYNGLMRFNGRGEFNTAFCKKPERFRPAYVTRICNQVQWAADAMAGRDWEFVCADWRETLDRADAADFIYADPPYAGRNADYHNRWTDDDEAALVTALRSAPCRFLCSLWVENRFRRNTRLLERFAGCEVVTRSHHYHVGPTRDRRHDVIEGLAVGP